MNSLRAAASGLTYLWAVLLVLTVPPDLSAKSHQQLNIIIIMADEK